jgi:hypothetical protein
MKAKSDLTRVRRLPERGRYAREDIYAVLDAAPYCHIAHLIAGRPVCTPTLHWRIDDQVWAGVIPVRQAAARAAIAEGVPGGVKPPRLSVAQRGRR